MLNINLKARLGNKTFWVSLVSAVVLLLQQCGLDASKLIPSNYVDIINSVFAILTILGIVVDTSTPGVNDQTPTVTNTSNSDTPSQLAANNVADSIDNQKATQTDTSNVTSSNTDVPANTDNSNTVLDGNTSSSSENDIKNAIVVNSTITPKANTADDTTNVNA